MPHRCRIFMVFFRKDLFTKQEVAAFKRLVEDVRSNCICMVWPRVAVDTVLAGDFYVK